MKAKEIAYASLLFSVIATNALGYTVKRNDTLTEILQGHKGKITNPAVTAAIDKNPGFAYLQLSKEFARETIHPGDTIDLDSVLEEINALDYRVPGTQVDSEKQPPSPTHRQSGVVIDRGDTYWSIAQELYQAQETERTVAEIADILQQTNPYEATKLQPGDFVSFSGLGVKPVEPDKQPASYTIKKGDTYWEIAQHLRETGYTAPAQEIVNKLIGHHAYKPTNLPVGGTLDLSILQDAKPAQQTQEQAAEQTVQEQTLESTKEQTVEQQTPESITIPDDPSHERLFAAIMNNDKEGLESIVQSAKGKGHDRLLLHSMMFTASPNRDLYMERARELGQKSTEVSHIADMIVEEDLYSLIKEADFADNLNSMLDIVDSVKTPAMAAILTEGVTVPLVGLGAGKAVYDFISKENYLSAEEELQLRYGQLFLRFYPESQKAPEVEGLVSELMEKYANSTMTPALENMQELYHQGDWKKARMLLSDLDYHMSLTNDSAIEAYKERSEDIRELLSQPPKPLVTEQASQAEQLETLARLDDFMNGKLDDPQVQLPEKEASYMRALKNTFGSVYNMAEALAFATAGSYEEGLEDVILNTGELLATRFVGEAMSQQDKDYLNEARQAIRSLDEEEKKDELRLEVGSMYLSNGQYLEAMDMFQEVNSEAYSSQKEELLEKSKHSYFDRLLDVAEDSEGKNKMLLYSIVLANDEREASQIDARLALAEQHMQYQNPDAAKEHLAQLDEMDIPFWYLGAHLKMHSLHGELK
ncbi:MAG: LysM peptidoglycan-binding domain-containing protein [Nanobdellota archaeon]